MNAAALSTTCRTGVRFAPMITGIVIIAPSQWKKFSTSGPEMPGKKYLLPPEKPITSCGNVGPMMTTWSYSHSRRLTSTRTSSFSRQCEMRSTSSAGIVPMTLSSFGSSQRWLKMPNLPNLVLRSAAGIFSSRLIASSLIGGWVPSAMMKSSFDATAPAVSHISRNSNGSGQVRVLSGMRQTTLFPRSPAASIARVKICRTSSSVSARSLKPRPFADMAFILRFFSPRIKALRQI